MPDAKLYCGTSGFAYNSWTPDFYPQNITVSQRLTYYATRLNAVELSYPRRFKPLSKLEKWTAATPGDFLFLPKVRVDFKSAGINAVKRLFQNLHPLQKENRLGPVLFQIPSPSKSDRDSLLRFLGLLPKGVRAAFEFSNVSWFDESIYQLLRDANAALCLTESDDLESPWVLTADFVYLRPRKLEYLESKLTGIQYRVEQYLANAYPTFVIFKGGKSAAGALNAEKLRISQKAVGTLK